MISDALTCPLALLITAPRCVPQPGEARRAEALAAILARQQEAAANIREAAERRRQAEAERLAQLEHRQRRKEEVQVGDALRAVPCLVTVCEWVKQGYIHPQLLGSFAVRDLQCRPCDTTSPDQCCDYYVYRAHLQAKMEQERRAAIAAREAARAHARAAAQQREVVRQQQASLLREKVAARLKQAAERRWVTACKQGTSTNCRVVGLTKAGLQDKPRQSV